LDLGEKGVYPSYTHVTAKKNDDGTTTIYLGDWGKEQSNCLPTAGKGFYHEWRMYGAEKPILEGKWSFPDPVEVK
jgi:hypothetical protein